MDLIAFHLGMPAQFRRDSGKFEECTQSYREVVTQHAPHDPRLQKALQDAEGKPTGAEKGSQGWIFRYAMDAVLASAETAPSRDQICADITEAIDSGEVVITNDGATILKKMKLNHP